LSGTQLSGDLSGILAICPKIFTCPCHHNKSSADCCVVTGRGIWCGMNAAGCYFQCSTLYLIIQSSTLASNRKDAYFTFAALVPRCLCIYKVKFANSALKTTKQKSPTKTNLCKASLKFLHSVWFRLLRFNGIQAACKTTDFTQHIRRAHSNDVLHGVSSR